MRAWLRPVLDRLRAGLVPIDGDFGRREPASRKNDPCHQVQPVRHASHPPADEAAWIPRTILYGPPL